MSYGRELLNDYAFEIDYPFGLPSNKWKTKDGRTILISDMSEAHIKNCMKIVGEDDAWYEIFTQELKRRKL